MPTLHVNRSDTKTTPGTKREGVLDALRSEPDT